MRARLLVVVSCVCTMLAAACWTTVARSQAPVTPTTTTAPVLEPAPAVSAAPTEPAPDPAPTEATLAPEQSAQTAQTEEPSDSEVPEIVVEFPETDEAGEDTSDDGELELVTPEPRPAPQPVPAPVAAPQEFAQAEPAPAPAPAPEPAPDPKPEEPKKDPGPTPAEERAEEAAEEAADEAAAEAAEEAAIEDEQQAAAVAAAEEAAAEAAAIRAATPEGLRDLEPYKPAAHAEEVLAMTAGAAATIGALAAGLGAAAGGGGGGGGGGSRRAGAATSSMAGAGPGGSGGDGEGGWLEDVELERNLAALPGLGWGDRSKTWGWRTTPHIDTFSKHWPDRLAKVSPVMSRVSIDGDYLRAMFGGLYLLIYPAAVVLGIVAANSTGGAALPPALGFFVAILALSIFDSMVGYTAGLSFAAALAAKGYITDAASIRTTAALVLIWFAVPLAAAAIRPLRRNLDLSITGLWDRSADFVLAGLFGGFVAANQVYAISPLRGYELPIADQRWTIALIVIGLVGLRILTETAATHFYPERLEAVEAEGELEPPRIQESISIGIQMGVLAFVSASFLPLGWALIVGTVVFFAPLIPWLFIERLPYSAFVAKWMPAGLAKWAFIIIGGVGLMMLMDKLVTDPTKSIEWGYIVLPLPLLLCWGLELFAENEPEDEEEEEESETAADAEEEDDDARFPMTWPLRLAGVPVTAACVYTVLVVIG